MVDDGSGAPAETVKVSEGAGDLVIRFEDDLSVRSWGWWSFMYCFSEN